MSEGLGSKEQMPLIIVTGTRLPWKQEDSLRSLAPLYRLLLLLNQGPTRNSQMGFKSLIWFII